MVTLNVRGSLKITAIAFEIHFVWSILFFYRLRQTLSYIENICDIEVRSNVKRIWNFVYFISSQTLRRYFFVKNDWDMFSTVRFFQSIGCAILFFFSVDEVRRNTLHHALVHCWSIDPSELEHYKQARIIIWRKVFHNKF